MNKSEYRVKYLLKIQNKTVGAEIENLRTGEIKKIEKKFFIQFTGLLDNALVTKNGVIRGNGCVLDTKDINGNNLVSTSTGNIYNSSNKTGNVKTYTIMYENRKVLKFNRDTDEIIIYNKELLPFYLRGKERISVANIIEWITDRVSNINRTYMNMVYVARNVGRDKNKIIKDSSGISFTDNFWIKTNDMSTEWNELNRLRDENKALNNVALTGKINTSDDLDNGYTSLFTTKGYFPKAVLGGYLYKLQKDSILEYPAYLIAKELGIDIAECSLIDNYVRIKIFTNYNESLAHASELKAYFNTDGEIYNEFLRLDRSDIVTQLQRMYIFNYIIGNPDLHDDNYGVIYNAKNFEIIKLAPCFDHNIAFQEGFNGFSRVKIGDSSLSPLDYWTELFIINHGDIVKKLEKLKFKDIQKYINEMQLNELKQRIDNVIRWYNCKDINK